MANNLPNLDSPRPAAFPTVAAHRRERLRQNNLARRQRQAARLALKPPQAAPAPPEGSDVVPESEGDTGMPCK
jgi:hypothetical protein